LRRAVIVVCCLFLACDRADELLAAAVLEALADKPVKPGEHAADCAKGADRMAAPHIQMLVHCRPVDAGRPK